MELAYFDTETPYIKFQSFPARSFAPKAREHALPRHPPSSLLPPPPLRAMEILGHRSIRGIPRGPWRNGRAGEVLYVSRAGFKNSRAGHRVAGTTTLSTLKRDTFVGNLLSVRKRRRRRRTRYARVSPLSFFSLSLLLRPCFLSSNFEETAKDRFIIRTNLTDLSLSLGRSVWKTRATRQTPRSYGN